MLHAMRLGEITIRHRHANVEMLTDFHPVWSRNSNDSMTYRISRNTVTKGSKRKARIFQKGKQ